MHISQSKHPSVAEQHSRMRAAEMAVVNAARAGGWKITDATQQRVLRERVEELSGGKNTVLYTAEGCPGIYVRIAADANALSDAIATECGISGYNHDAFLMGTKRLSEFYIGKYQGLCVDQADGEIDIKPDGTQLDRRILSLPGLDPVADIDFDAALTYCRQNGDGFHLVTNAEWAYLYLLTLSWGFEPRGNNSYGDDTYRTDEKCEFNSWGDGDGGDRRALCGTGPVSWTHDGTPYGVWDLNGNVWEWVAGYRCKDGELQILPNNDAASATADMGDNTNEWQGIVAADGSLAAPGTAGNCHWDASNADGSGSIILDDAVTNQSDGSTSANTQFKDLTAAAGITVPELLKRLCLFPLDAAEPTRGRMYMRNLGERLPFRGGDWNGGSSAGVAALYGLSARTSRGGILGCRPAFVL